jgi:hypothetical protein
LAAEAVKNGYPAVVLILERSDDGLLGRDRQKHCQQFGKARVNTNGSARWSEHFAALHNVKSCD